MGRNADIRGPGNGAKSVSRRAFLSKSARPASVPPLWPAPGPPERAPKSRTPRPNGTCRPTWWSSGPTSSGLAAAISARDSGASVISVEENFDIGGRGMLSGGRVHLGGGHALQQKAGIKDSADQVFKDWIRFDSAVARYSDRDLVRVFADENVPTFNFLVENGVEFIEKPIGPEAASTVPRTFVTVEWQNQDEIYAPGSGRNGSGLVRRLEQSARRKGVQILLRHEMKNIVREQAFSGRVEGITVAHPGGTLAIEARKGVIIATGGHTGNVNFRRTFDPRLTEEYQQACLPYVVQGRQGPTRRHGDRSLALGGGEPDPGQTPPSPRRATSAAVEAMAPGVPARKQAVPARQGDRSHG